MPTATPAQPPQFPVQGYVSRHAQLGQKLQPPAGQEGVVPLQPGKILVCLSSPCAVYLIWADMLEDERRGTFLKHVPSH